MAAAFIDDPATSPDAGCMAAMTGPDFITADELYVTPAIYRLNVELLAMRDPGHFGVSIGMVAYFMAVSNNFLR